MAPPNHAAKPQKAGTSKKPARPVVPAIPLPHVKRAAAKAAASSKRASSPASEPKSGTGVEGAKAKESSPAVSTVTTGTANDSVDAQATTSSTPPAAAPNGHDHSRGMLPSYHQLPKAFISHAFYLDEDQASKTEGAQTSQPASVADVRDDNKLHGDGPHEQDTGNLPNGTQAQVPKPNSGK